MEIYKTGILFHRNMDLKEAFFLLNRIQRIFLKESKLSEIYAFILMVGVYFQIKSTSDNNISGPLIIFIITSTIICLLCHHPPIYNLIKPASNCVALVSFDIPLF